MFRVRNTFQKFLCVSVHCGLTSHRHPKGPDLEYFPILFTDVCLRIDYPSQSPLVWTSPSLRPVDVPRWRRLYFGPPLTSTVHLLRQPLWKRRTQTRGRIRIMDTQKHFEFFVETCGQKSQELTSIISMDVRSVLVMFLTYSVNTSHESCQEPCITREFLLSIEKIMYMTRLYYRFYIIQFLFPVIFWYIYISYVSRHPPFMYIDIYYRQTYKIL